MPGLESYKTAAKVQNHNGFYVLNVNKRILDIYFIIQ